MIALNSDSKAAVLIDYENVVRARTSDGNEDFVSNILTQVGSRASIVVRRAYGDWGRFAKAKRHLARLGFELIELPSGCAGKNRADIKLAVDAMELALTRDFIDTFAIVSGDSDFVPLAAKLQELNRDLWWFASSHSYSELLSPYCSELTLLSDAEAVTTAHQSNMRKSAVSAVAVAVAPTAPVLTLRPELLSMLSWSILACFEQSNVEEHRFDQVIHAFRKLYPETKLETELGNIKFPHRTLAKHLDELGLIVWRLDAELGKHVCRMGALVMDLAIALPRPLLFFEVAEDIQMRLAKQSWKSPEREEVK